MPKIVKRTRTSKGRRVEVADPHGVKPHDAARQQGVRYVEPDETGNREQRRAAARAATRGSTPS